MKKYVLLRVKERRNILNEINKRKANCIGHILRRNCLLQQVIKGKIKGVIEVTGRRGRRRRKLLDDLKERRGYSLLKEEDLGRTMWRARFRRGFGPVVRQTTEWMYVYLFTYFEIFHSVHFPVLKNLFNYTDQRHNIYSLHIISVAEPYCCVGFKYSSLLGVLTVSFTFYIRK
jgi:hypothetical protein